MTSHQYSTLVGKKKSRPQTYLRYLPTADNVKVVLPWLSQSPPPLPVRRLQAPRDRTATQYGIAKRCLLYLPAAEPARAANRGSAIDVHPRSRDWILPLPWDRGHGCAFGVAHALIILAGLSTMFVVTSILWLVPSPRRLALHGRQAEASAAWDIPGVSHTEREKAENVLAATGVEARNLVDSVDATR